MEFVEENKTDYLFKVIVVGDSGVGKTNILNRYLKDEFIENTKNTLGVDFSMKTLNINSNEIKIQFWDTAGQERFKAMNQNYYKNVAGIIMVYDITEKTSFSSLNKYFIDIEEKCDDFDKVNIIIFGNKTDLNDSRTVNKNDIDDLSKERNLKIIEISAKSNCNNEVQTNFNKFIEDIYYKYEENYESQYKSAYYDLRSNAVIKKLPNPEDRKKQEKSKCC